MTDQTTPHDAEQRLAPLLTPFRLGELELANRFAMAPMTRRFSPGGVPGADVAAYYARRAASGVGLIITEGTYIDHPSAGDTPGVPYFWGAEAAAGWRRVAAAVHDAGGRIFPQLWHVGAERGPADHDGERPEILSPSARGTAGTAVGREMTIADIDAVIAAYARGAALAKELGFDGVEIHGAHGYLIDQFMWASTNLRTDRYGGSITDRGRFGTEVVAAMRAAVGPDFPIAIRFSQWKVDDYQARTSETPADLEALLIPLAEAGVTLFHASTRRFWVPAFEGSPLTLAGWAKKITGRPTMAVGNVGLEDPSGGGTHGDSVPPQVDRLLDLFAAGEFDLVAVGRALIPNYDWVDAVRRGEGHRLLPFSTGRTPQLF